MTHLLIRLYPSRWRERYGDELAAILDDRPVGPFDAADLLLGALDAHMHLRGVGAASEHRKGFAMSLRIGGVAAVVGGLGWLFVLAGSAINDGRDEFAFAIGLGVMVATVATLIALIGLSAFQSRRHPALTWAAFAIPCAGAVVGLLGWVAIVMMGDSDAAIVAGLSAWAIASIGLAAMVLGSSLFALATWLTRSLSRRAAALLGIGALLVAPTAAGVTGGLLPAPMADVLVVVSVAAFPLGWVALGLSALRIDRPAGSAAAAA